MRKEQLAAKELMLLGIKLYPQYARAFESAIEDIDDIEPLSGGSDFNRIFRAIDEGYNLLSEIARRADVEKDECERLLGLMVRAGAIVPEKQGGKTEGARGARKILYMRASKQTAVKTLDAIANRIAPGVSLIAAAAL